MYVPISLALATLSLVLPRTEFGHDDAGSFERDGWIQADGTVAKFQAPGAFPATAGPSVPQSALREQAKNFRTAAAQVAGDGETLPEIVNEAAPSVKLTRDGSDERWVFGDGADAYTVVGDAALNAHADLCDQLADAIQDTIG